MFQAFFSWVAICQASMECQYFNIHSSMDITQYIYVVLPQSKAAVFIFCLLIDKVCT